MVHLFLPLPAAVSSSCTIDGPKTVCQIFELMYQCCCLGFEHCEVVSSVLSTSISNFEHQKHQRDQSHQESFVNKPNNTGRKLQTMRVTALSTSDERNWTPMDHIFRPPAIAAGVSRIVDGLWTFYEDLNWRFGPSTSISTLPSIEMQVHSEVSTKIRSKSLGQTTHPRRRKMSR